MEQQIELTEIKGEIETITYRNDENGWSVIKVKSDRGLTFTATGLFSYIKVGEYFSLKGQWVEHKSHGRQFKVELGRPIHPTTQEGIIRYLSSGLIKGIGKITAKRIVEHFKEETLEILNRDPSRMAEVDSIGPKKAKTIEQAWRDSREYRDAELFLFSHHLSPSLTHRIIKAYRGKTIEIVKEDPYRLSTEIGGIGFLTADKIAQSIDFDPVSGKRIKAAILYSLSQAEDHGHCFLSTPQMLEKLIQLLSLDHDQLHELILQALHELNLKGSLITETRDGGDIHYLQELLVAEDTMAKKITELLDQPFHIDEQRVESWLNKYSERLAMPLSHHQLEAVKAAVSHRVFVLTGGPGVGKTTTANAIIRLLSAMKRSVALAAPTGRAAQRLSEVTGQGAKTVHRLLEWTPQDNGFSRDESNPLNASAIVVDEASMLDIRLANALVQAISHQAQIIFIGDVDQLPSVGPGNVLRDLIDSQKVPFTRLTEIFRQAASSHIVSIAHQINDGQFPQFPDQDGADCRMIEVSSVDEIKSIICDLVGHILPDKGHYDSIRDIQVLTPMNRGDLGTKTLNQELQALLNPADDHEDQEKKVDSTVFRPGDKVIQVSNNYELNVFNGDIGFVQHAGVDGGKIIVSFGDRRVSYSKEDAYDLKLAYAITIHKSQGSEFPVVIIPLAMQHFVMLQRNLIYTALTRARKFAIFVGTAQALDHAIKTQTSLNRQTQLVQRICHYL
ncbi:SF1B family DNA helicase RecD2 [Pseudobacteriovorax antillogorgiicola]|uniref:Exodeoxyribonuclease V alpha subunit n=1 Tax=Pseudobacteriovorax antillogorgiicola TaxID=1513793 RepID=A0A1Y6C2T9_9BACT|nr:ATP-dependent RecD-like DNA helicase [Pseudobacteriovorax antillogorgiicola]TCS50293.1 exodeoxyribonuclease V alpha subunit [Pseudobacteriovorax antillogorgiicola]SMF33918.1 exodeoxyribonuclease V alpha subunit [Pseudobacteriovorax antillogorgiicola]